MNTRLFKRGDIVDARGIVAYSQTEDDRGYLHVIFGSKYSTPATIDLESGRGVSFVAPNIEPGFTVWDSFGAKHTVVAIDGTTAFLKNEDGQHDLQDFGNLSTEEPKPLNPATVKTPIDHFTEPNAMPAAPAEGIVAEAARYTGTHTKPGYTKGENRPVDPPMPPADTKPLDSEAVEAALAAAGRVEGPEDYPI